MAQLVRDVRKPWAFMIAALLGLAFAFWGHTYLGERAMAQDAPDDTPAITKSKAKPKSPRKSAANLPANPFANRIKARGLDGGVGWINTAGPLELEDLKGKFVLLDFWTYCCINCIHILPELKKLEEKYPNELVVIGVHSAKFENEQDSQNITDAVLRYEIKHPVINDAHHAIWNRYGVQSWPTMLLIDPEGYAVYARSGEFKAEDVVEVLERALPYYRKKGVIDETPLKFDLAADLAEITPLRYPGKLIADSASDRLFIADSNHNRIVISKLDGTLLETIGSGVIGKADGDFATASFDHPQGMALLDQTLYVADTENHLLRKIDLEAQTVTTIAGVGEQGRNAWPGIDEERLGPGGTPLLPERYVGPPRTTAINSPWDLWIHQGDLYIAMAGPHQIWKMPLSESEIGPYAGNGREDIVDGPLLPSQPYELGYSSFAQPSGLASDGKWLYVADSEGSSIRAVPFSPQGKVETPIGTSHLGGGRLFQFGDVDGKGKVVRLQHALGVVHREGLLYVADTYNNKIKVIDPKKSTSKTLAGTGKPGHEDSPATFDEPAGITVAGDKLYVADTNNHLIRVIDLGNDNQVSTLTIVGLEPPVKPTASPSDEDLGQVVALPAAKVQAADGNINLEIQLTLPEGYKINDLAPMKYRLAAAQEDGPVDRGKLGKATRVEPPAATTVVKVPVTANSGDDQVRISLDYYYCQEGAEGICRTGTVTWEVPLTVADDGEASIPLPLAVVIE